MNNKASSVVLCKTEKLNHPGCGGGGMEVVVFSRTLLAVYLLVCANSKLLLGHTVH